MDIRDVLSRIKNVKPQGTGHTGSCPAHEDKNNSLSVSVGADRKILLYCHAGCDTEQIVNAIGIKLEDLFEEKPKEPEKKKIVAEYEYRDLSGNVIHKTIRYEPKGFSQCAKCQDGTWKYSLKDVKTVLYNLKEVAESVESGKIIFVVEGEKDCDNMKMLGYTATTSPMGAGKWKDEYSDYLTGANVIIIPDNDETGKKHSLQVANSLLGKARSIKIIDLSKETDMPTKSDVTDFFKMLGKKVATSSLNRLIESAKEFTNEIEMIERNEYLDYAMDLADVKPYDADRCETVLSSIPTLNQKINGYGMGKLTVMTALNTAGKSTILGQEVINAVDQGYNSFIFSGELLKDNCKYWIDLQAAGSTYLTMKTSHKTGNTYYDVNPSAKEHIHKWYQGKIFLFDNKNGTEFSKVLKTMECYNKEKKCRFFVIDNLMRIDLQDTKNQNTAESKFINDLANFAQNTNSHVIVVAHPRKIQGVIITKTDIAGSGNLSNRPDNIIAIHKVTPQFRQQMEDTVKNKNVLNNILGGTNILEIFKCRETGIQDLMIPCEYSPESKRITDKKYPDTRNKKYGWERMMEQPTQQRMQGDMVKEIKEKIEQTKEEDMPWD